jgi:hypothetical protein
VPDELAAESPVDLVAELPVAFVAELPGVFCGESARGVVTTGVASLAFGVFVLDGVCDGEDVSTPGLMSSGGGV